MEDATVLALASTDCSAVGSSGVTLQAEKLCRVRFSAAETPELPEASKKLGSYPWTSLGSVLAERLGLLLQLLLRRTDRASCRARPM